MGRLDNIEKLLPSPQDSDKGIMAFVDENTVLTSTQDRPPVTFRDFLDKIEQIHEILENNKDTGDNLRELEILEEEIQRLAGVPVEEAS